MQDRQTTAKSRKPSPCERVGTSVFGCLLCAAVAVGCAETGRIEGVSLSDCHSENDSVSLSVRLDDGHKVNAARGKDNNRGVITGGQKVKIKKIAATPSGEECWEVIEWVK
jgi:hypothetical protein